MANEKEVEKKPEKKPEKKKIIQYIENIKKVDVKHLVKVFTLIWGLVLIVLMTITNVGINKDFNFIDWLGRSLIIFGIMVFGLLMGETSGKDKQMKKPDGLYQRNLKQYDDFNHFLSENGEIIYFNQFYSWLLPQELVEKKIEYLIVMGVEPKKAEKIVKYCSKRDLGALKEHILEVKDENGKVVTVIRQLEEYEIEPVTEILDGKILLNAANANYFLSAFEEGKINSRLVEEGRAYEKERGRNRRTNRAIKITTSLAISLGWGVLTVYDFASGEDTQAWVNLVSRITALFTSFFSGWLSSVIDVKLQAQIIESKYKMLVLFHTYLVKRIFIPKSEEELVKEELKAYHEAQEEAKKNIVEPETAPSIEQKEENKPLEIGEISSSVITL